MLINRKINNFGKFNKKEDINNNIILGDEWENWDGETDVENFDTSKTVFYILMVLLFLILNGCLHFIFYLIYPRISEVYYLPQIILVIIILFNFLSIMYLVNLFLIIYIHTRFTSNAKIRKGIDKIIKLPLLGFMFDKVITLSKLLKLSVDRVRNSFIKVNNIITKVLDSNRTNGDIDNSTKDINNTNKILILLPRCLKKDILEKLKGYEKYSNVKICVVSGGSLARKKIKEYTPDKILCVACERDLVSGIRDIKGKIPILAIPNQRPNGPCNNTTIDLNEFQSFFNSLYYQ